MSSKQQQELKQATNPEGGSGRGRERSCIEEIGFHLDNCWGEAATYKPVIKSSVMVSKVYMIGGEGGFLIYSPMGHALWQLFPRALAFPTYPPQKTRTARCR